MIENGEFRRPPSPAYASVADPDKSANQLVAEILDGTVVPTGDGQGNIRRRVERLMEIRTEAPTDVVQALEYVFD